MFNDRMLNLPSSHNNLILKKNKSIKIAHSPIADHESWSPSMWNNIILCLWAESGKSLLVHVRKKRLHFWSQMRVLWHGYAPRTTHIRPRTFQLFTTRSSFGISPCECPNASIAMWDWRRASPTCKSCMGLKPCEYQVFCYTKKSVHKHVSRFFVYVYWCIA